MASIPFGTTVYWDRKLGLRLRLRSLRRNHAWTWASHALRHGLRHGSDHSHRRSIQPPPYPRLHPQRLLRPRHRLLLRLALLRSRFLSIFPSRRNPSSPLLHPHSGYSSLPLLLLALLFSTPQGPPRFRFWGESIHSTIGRFRNSVFHFWIIVFVVCYLNLQNCVDDVIGSLDFFVIDYIWFSLL